MVDKNLAMCTYCGKYLPKVEMWVTQGGSSFCMEHAHQQTAIYDKATKGLTVDEMLARK